MITGTRVSLRMLPQHLEPVEPRHHHVEQHGVERAALELRKAVTAVASVGHEHVVLLKKAFQELEQPDIVVDHERGNGHGGVSILAPSSCCAPPVTDGLVCGRRPTGGLADSAQPSLAARYFRGSWLR